MDLLDYHEVTVNIQAPFQMTPQFIETSTNAPPSTSLLLAGGLSTAPPATYQASVGWGDGTISSGTVSAFRCFFAFTCMNVYGQHTYATDGVYPVSVEVTDAVTGAVEGITRSYAQVFTIASLDALYTYMYAVNAHSPVGVLEWAGVSKGEVQYTACSATVLGNTDIVVTASHCFDTGKHSKNYDFEFAPDFAHFDYDSQSFSGTNPTCSENRSDPKDQNSVPLAQCGTNPAGIFTAEHPPVFTSGDVAFVVMDYGNEVFNGTAPNVSADVTPIAVRIQAALDTDWSTVGFATRTLDWNERSCGEPNAALLPSQFTDNGGNPLLQIQIPPPDGSGSCFVAPPTTLGMSGSPMLVGFGGISENEATIGIGGTLTGFCVPGQCHTFGLELPHGSYATGPQFTPNVAQALISAYDANGCYLPDTC